MKVTMAQLAVELRRIADETLPQLGVEMIRGSASEATAILVAKSPILTGRFKHSWDPRRNSSRSFSASSFSRAGGKTADAALAALRGIKPGDRAMVSNAARDPGRDSSYATLLWEGRSRQAPQGLEMPLKRHLVSTGRKIFDEAVDRSQRRR